MAIFCSTSILKSISYGHFLFNSNFEKHLKSKIGGENNCVEKVFFFFAFNVPKFGTFLQIDKRGSQNSYKSI